MSDDRWIQIRYRDFWDIPRAIHLRWHGVDLLLDCPFDEALQDYFEEYRILRLTEPPPDEGSWVPAIDQGVELARVPVTSIKFDETRREFIERSSVESVLAALLESPRTA
jgi:hypothetical protein